jgi:DNA/RNA endonuclease YhcR with UshA esterase domain
MPTEDNKGDIAIVIGKVELYKGKPQIAVRKPEGLRIVASESVTPAKQ